ncbi:glycosyltransferase [Coraliomargarita sp. W4R53]
MHARNLAWLLSLLFAAAGAWGYAMAAPEFDAAGGPRVLCFLMLGVAGLMSVFLFPRFQQRRAVVLAIWMPAIILRVLLLPTAPSDDVSRYLWEGRLVNEGVSPYAQTADAESVRAYRDAQWAQMNHKDQPTAYPPLSELSFAAVAQVAYHPLAFKLFFLLADLLTLAAVLRLLQLRGIALQYSGFYALSPIVLISYAGEGHFDALMVAALVWGIWAAAVGRDKLSVVLVSLATGVKWIALPLLPFFILGTDNDRGISFSVMWNTLLKRIPYVLIALLTLILPALFFWESLPALFEGLFQFGGTRSFNGPVYDLLLLGLNLPRAACSALVLGFLAGVCLWRWCVRDSSTLDAHARWILGALIVLSPTVHFWYLAWILPFVCLRPSLPWVILSLTSGLYFLVWSNEAWGLTLWQRWAFWLPFFLALVYEFWSTRGRVMFPARRPQGEPVTISIVIPTLNVADQLEGALSSIARQSTQPIEIICVDAGSTDETVALAKESHLPVQVIESEQGRGQQIAAGIEVAAGSWVCVLHADAVLAPLALASLARSVAADPAICGGAFGQRFEENQAELLPIEVLNDGRALFSRTAFGDQVQFFHRATAVREQLMPKQPLMEDVESSWRLRETGGFLFLNQPCEVCHRSWKASEWFTRFRLVMRLVSQYRFARLSSRAKAEALSHELYQEYYKTSK